MRRWSGVAFCGSTIPASFPASAMSAAKVLDSLQRVRQTRPNNYVAACPCCQSRRGQPVSVRVLDDGRVLIKAFCGCETESVLGALGLTMADLFEQPLNHHIEPSHSRIPARDLLACIHEEALVVAIIGSDFLREKTIDETAWSRLATAVSRIGEAANHGH